MTRHFYCGYDRAPGICHRGPSLLYCCCTVAAAPPPRGRCRLSTNVNLLTQRRTPVRFVLNGAAAVVAFAIATIAWPPPPASGADPTTPAFFGGVAVSSISALRPAAVCSALPTPAPDADGPARARLPADDNKPCTDEQLARAARYLVSQCGDDGGSAKVWCHASGSIRVHIRCRPPPDAILEYPPR